MKTCLANSVFLIKIEKVVGSSSPAGWSIKQSYSKYINLYINFTYIVYFTAPYPDPKYLFYSLGETNLISRLTGVTDPDLSKIEKIIIFCPISVSSRILFLYKLCNYLNNKKLMISPNISALSLYLLPINWTATPLLTHICHLMTWITL